MKAKYTIGIMNFQNKKEITGYTRQLIDSFKRGTKISKKEIAYYFASEMIKLHPNYDGFLENGSKIELFIINDNEADSKGYGLWKIFSFKYKDKNNVENHWGFSTQKIIKNLKPNKK